MKGQKLIFIFKCWVIGMVVVVVHFLLHLQHLFIGIILGIINTFFTEPFSKTMDKEHVGEEKLNNK